MSDMRHGHIDALRTFGIVAVVVGHVNLTEPMRLLVAPWHVPVFFFLSGYLWRRGGRTVRDEAQKRFFSLAVPYLFWLAVVGVIWFGYNAFRGDFDPKAVIQAVYGGAYATRPFSAFWFVTALFFACLLYRWMQRLPLWATMTLILGSVCAIYVVGGLVSRAPLAVLSALPCLVFVVGGELFARVESRIPWGPAVGAAGLAVASVLVVTRISEPLDLKNGNFGTPVVSVVVAGVICASLLLVLRPILEIAPGVGRTTTALALPGLVVVLTHALVLAFLKTPPTGGAVDLILALVLPWALALAFAHYPGSRRFTGQESRNTLTWSR